VVGGKGLGGRFGLLAIYNFFFSKNKKNVFHFQKKMFFEKKKSPIEGALERTPNL